VNGYDLSTVDFPFEYSKVYSELINGIISIELLKEKTRGIISENMLIDILSELYKSNMLICENDHYLGIAFPNESKKLMWWKDYLGSNNFEIKSC
jgi:hypothetical protein